MKASGPQDTGKADRGGADHGPTPGKASRAAAQQDVEVAVGDTNKAELEDFVPIDTDEGKARRVVVLHLKPSELPALQAGDKLTTPTELQLTTAGDVTTGGYDPNVSMKIILTNQKKGTRGKVVTDRTGKTLTRQAHHTVFTFGREASTTVDQQDLAGGNPYVNMVVWAWHSKAKSGGNQRVDRVLVGGNHKDYLQNGKVEQGDARMMAIADHGPDGNTATKRQEVDIKPSDTLRDGDKDVTIASHKLQDVKKGEQFFVEASFQVNGNGRPRFSTQLRLEDKQSRKVADPGSIGEENGTNPTGSTAYRKVAVFAVEDDKKAIEIKLTGTVGAPGHNNPSVKVTGGKLKIERHTPK